MQSDIEFNSRLSLRYGPRDYDWALPGFTVLISGAPSAGKSTLTEPMIAACLNGGNDIFKTVSKDNTVLHIDTDLPKELYLEQRKRIQSLSVGGDMENYRYFNLVEQVTFDQKRQKVIELVDNNPSSFIFIDNLSGLCRPTDEHNAYDLIFRLNPMIVKRGSILVSISHLNNGGTEKGHVGKVFKELSSTSVMVTLLEDYGISVVSPNKDRIGGMPKIMFKVGEDKKIIMGPYMPFPT